MRRLLLLAVAVFCSYASAGTVYVPSSGSLTASVYTDFTTYAFYDVRGAIAGVLDGATPLLITDSTFGADPDFLTIPFGNTELSGFTPDLLNVVGLTFDFNGSTIVGDVLTVPVVAAYFTNGNSSLDTLLGSGLSASFLYSNTIDSGNGNFLVQYGLTSLDLPDSEVPEPSTMLLAGSSLIALVLFGKRRRT